MKGPSALGDKSVKVAGALGPQTSKARPWSLPASGYEMRTVAAELHGFVEALTLMANGPVDIVCHDLGTWMGYAYAAE